MAGIFTRPKTEDLPTEATKLSAATLGSDIEFKGSLSFNDRLCINGKFEGDLTSEGGLLVVGPDAEIKAEIKVGNLVSEGKIYGNITVNDKVDLRSPAQLFGDIQGARLSIEEGVIFVGNTDVNPQSIEPEAEVKNGQAKHSFVDEENLLENQIKF